MVFDLVDGGYLTWLYASSPFSSNGWPPAKIRGSLLMLDSKEDTFRVQRDPSYKAQRKEKRHDTPEAWQRYQRIKAFREAIHDDPRVQPVRIPGLEADDLIGLAVWKWWGQHLTVLGQDKDLLQCGDFTMIDNRDDIITVDRFKKRLPKTIQHFKFTRESIPLLLALLGDKSDNIPRLIEPRALWRMTEILRKANPWDEAYRIYKKRLLSNLEAVMIPDCSVFDIGGHDLFNVVRQGAWRPDFMMPHLKEEYAREVARWTLPNSASVTSESSLKKKMTGTLGRSTRDDYEDW